MKIKVTKGKVLVSRETSSGGMVTELVDIPSKEKCDEMLGTRYKQEAKDRIYEMMIMRSEGKTNKEVGLAFGVSAERVRQLGARFENDLRKIYWPRSKSSLTTVKS